MDIGTEKRSVGQADAVMLAKMLAGLEAYKKKVDGMRGLSMMAKANQAEAVLEEGALLITKITLIVHQYAGRAELLESNQKVLFERVNDILSHYDAVKMDKLKPLIIQGGRYET